MTSEETTHGLELVEQLILDFGSEVEEHYHNVASKWIVGLASTYANELLNIRKFTDQHAFRNIQNRLNDLKAKVIRRTVSLLDQCYFDQESPSKEFCYRILVFEPFLGLRAENGMHLYSNSEGAHIWGLFPQIVEPYFDSGSSLLSISSNHVSGFALDKDEKSGLVVDAYFNFNCMLFNDAQANARFHWLNEDHRSQSLFIYPLYFSKPSLIGLTSSELHEPLMFAVICLDTSVKGTWDRLSLDIPTLSRLFRPTRIGLQVLYATELLLAQLFHRTDCVERYLIHGED